MSLKLVLKILGGLLVTLSVIVMVPGAYGLLTGSPHASVFFQTGAGALAAGVLLWAWFHSAGGDVNHRTGFAVVTFSWFGAALLGAFPYYLSGTFESFVDAFFESSSGFSGTGSSVLTSIESQDRSILLWRSMTQWLGGMGIIVFYIAILPILGIGGVQLFRAETTGPQKDRITPRVQETAKTLWLLYLAFTVLLTIILVLLGMSVYDAVNHSMTTLSTGGFSTRDAGVGAFQSGAVEWAICAFMIIGSVNFSLHYRAIVLRQGGGANDTEFKAYLAILSVSILLLTLVTWSARSYESFYDALRNVAFTVAATASSTGYTNADYLAWPTFTHFVLVLLMVMGGMSGSTAGGMKCVRLVAAFKLLMKELKQAIHPSAVLSVKLNERTIRKNVASAIWGFLFTYLFICTVLIALVMFFEKDIDLVSAGTAVFSVLSNIGPAFGKFGPFDNFAWLTDYSKIVLSIGMVMGRLEFFTVLIVLTPEYWRK